MSEEMYLDNYKLITNIDYSQVIIDLMKKKCVHLDKMKWEVMDINDLQFNQKFDCIIEKGNC
jgi:EEF1A lysine methyltransferase 4